MKQQRVTREKPGINGWDSYPSPCLIKFEALDNRISESLPRSSTIVLGYRSPNDGIER